MSVAVRGQVVEMFHSAEIINEPPLNGMIRETCVRI